jgi:hypothetical protein
MIDVLLDTGAVMTRSQGTARCAGEQASLHPLGLGVVGDILYDDTPFAFDVHCTDGTGVNNVAGADVSFTANPVALVKRFTVVVGVVEFVLFQ